MGILQPYRGTYCSASLASEKLDIDTILSGCNAVDSEASHITEYANTLSTAGSNLDVNALSAGGTTMEGKVDEYCTNIKSVETFIMNTTSQIREAAEAAYNQIQEQMNSEAYARDQAEYNRRRNSG